MKYSKHELKKLEKQVGSKEELNRLLRNQALKSSFGIGISIIVSIGLVALIIYAILSRSSYKPYSSGPVHWHTKLAYNLCGDRTFLPEAVEGHGWLVHGHMDNEIHIEGTIGSEDDIRLKRYFENFQIPFGPDRIGPYKNGDVCPSTGVPGKLKVLINGKEEADFFNHVMKDGDKAEIIFE